jgi:CheY-like chemotaxis protein
VAQRVRALRSGVDAWVTKPCHPEELACAVSAVLRRNQRRELLPLQEPLDVGELTIRPDCYQACVDGRSLDLTAREFQLLMLLAQNERVLERGEIYERVWGYAIAHGDRSVDVFIPQAAAEAPCSLSQLVVHPYALRYRPSLHSRAHEAPPAAARSAVGRDERAGGGPTHPGAGRHAELSLGLQLFTSGSLFVDLRPRGSQQDLRLHGVA